MARKRWYKLDNAGKLYPSIASTRRSTVFRLSVKLAQNVDETILQQALDQVINRFPYYKVNLRRGLFWYYFEEVSHSPKVMAETYYPCMFLNFRQKGVFPFRVLYHKQYIHFEISHSIADGSAAMIFLKTLIIQYFKLHSDISCKTLEGSIALDSEIQPSEYEDAFHKHYVKGMPSPVTHGKAIRFPFELMAKGRYNFITGIVPTQEIRDISKSMDCTVTHLVGALVFMAIQDYMESLSPQGRKTMMGRIVLNIPVDLRRIYPSNTMRNFFVSFTPEIDTRLGTYELEEVIDYLKNYMKQHYREKYIKQFIGRNVRKERVLFIRLVPLWIKNLIMPFIYYWFGERGYTSSLSNLGLVKLPEEIRDQVEAIEFFPAPSEANKVKLCSCGYKDKLYLSFGSTTENRSIEKYFFRRLRRLGIPVRIESNFS